MEWAMQPKMNIVNNSRDYKKIQMCDIIHKYDDKKDNQDDPQNEENKEEPDQIISTNVVNKIGDDNVEILDLN